MSASMLPILLALAGSTAFGEDSPPSTPPASASPAASAPAVAAKDALKPSTVELDAVQPPATEKEVAAYEALIKDLKASAAAALLAVEQAREKIRTASTQIRIAAADQRARSMDLKAAKQELKVERIADSGAAERKAQLAVDDAREALAKARQTYRLRVEEQGLRHHQWVHAKAVRELEKAKLAEAKMRGEVAGAETADILKAQKDRVRAEATEARTRAAMAAAAARVARVEHAKSK